MGSKTNFATSPRNNTIGFPPTPRMHLQQWQFYPYDVLGNARQVREKRRSSRARVYQNLVSGHTLRYGPTWRLWVGSWSVISHVMMTVILVYVLPGRKHITTKSSLYTLNADISNSQARESVAYPERITSRNQRWISSLQVSDVERCREMLQIYLTFFLNILVIQQEEHKLPGVSYRVGHPWTCGSVAGAITHSTSWWWLLMVP